LKPKPPVEAMPHRRASACAAGVDIGIAKNKKQQWAIPPRGNLE